MRTRHLCHIPVASLAAATALQREITGIPDDPPAFRMEQARGTTRAEARLFSHVWLHTESQTLEFVRRLPEVGGQSRQTYPELREVLPEVEKLGAKRKPELYPLTTPELVALALSLGIIPTPQNREELLDRLEEFEEQP
jgi:hypothetical protein